VRGRWWTRLGGAVALAVTLYFAAHFPWRETWSVLAGADWTLLAAAGGLNLLSLAAKAWAWQLLLLPSAQVRWRTAQEAVFTGAAVGAVGVGVSGEAARLHLVGRRDGVSAAAALQSIVASRVVEAAALGLFLVTAVLAVAAPDTRRLVLLGAGLLAAGIALLRWVPWLRPRVRLAGPIALNVAGWALQWGTYHWSIAGARIAVAPSLSVLVLVLANVGGILRLTPGNLGIVPGAVILGLRPARVPVARALAAGLALQAVQVLPVLVIGLALLGRHGMRPRTTAP
jgi:uncharacterized membrane protein YbhN (UPF0104 family)